MSRTWVSGSCPVSVFATKTPGVQHGIQDVFAVFCGPLQPCPRVSFFGFLPLPVLFWVYEQLSAGRDGLASAESRPVVRTRAPPLHPANGKKKKNRPGLVGRQRVSQHLCTASPQPSGCSQEGGIPGEGSSSPANRQGVGRDKRCRKLVVMSWAQYLHSFMLRQVAGPGHGDLSVSGRRALVES